MRKTKPIVNKNSIKKPFGYIYLATNTITGKVYVGETVKPIRKRWIEHLAEGMAVKRLRIEQPHKRIYGSRLNNAIAKYGKLAWKLEKIDVAYSQEELDEKEKYWIAKYDSRNRDKGYNMTDGGVGSQDKEVIERIRNTLKQKYQKDTEYRKWMKKMNKIGRETVIRLRKEDPEFRKLMRDKLIRGNKDPVLRAKRSATMKKIMDEKYKDPEYKKRINRIITESNKRRKKKIPDIKKFLREIKSGAKLRVLAVKYNMSQDAIRYRIREILGKYGITTLIAAREFLQDKNEKRREVKKFLNDIKNWTRIKELLDEYNISNSTLQRRIKKILGKYGINNTTEAKEFLKDKDIDEVMKEIDK